MWIEKANVAIGMAAKITKFPNKFHFNEEDMKWENNNNFGCLIYRDTEPRTHTHTHFHIHHH